MTEQKYFKAFCMVENKITTFITNADDEDLLCCTTCGFCKSKGEEDKEIKKGI